jgi:rhamnosyltransferase
MSSPNDAFPSVAILLATYNGGPFVGDQIASILSQTAIDVHIYVRDDGSSDDTMTVVTEQKNAASDQITILRDGLGPTGSAAANFFALLEGADLARFDYVAFADQDDIWLPGKMQRAVECLSRQGSGGYSSNLLAWDPANDRYWMMEKHGAPKMFDYLFQGASAGCTYVLDTQTALLARRRLAMVGHQYCAGVSHDWTIYAICRSAGVPWFRDSQSFIHYRQHSGNVYGARPGFAGIAARLGMISSGWYRDHILWLEHVIENHADERMLLARIQSGSIRDRLYLAARANSFRRGRGDVWKLRLAIALGLLGK